MKLLATALFSLVVAIQASAKPVARAIQPLDVFVPTIIQPNAGSVWTAGQQEVVVWDTSNAPVNISNGAAVSLSGVGVLVSGFDLRSGHVIVTVPASTPKGLHTITLFGDSGDISEAFQIV